MSDTKNQNILTRKFESGQPLFYEGDLALSLFYVQKGQIRLFSVRGGREIEVGSARIGELIGEMSYFNSQRRRRSCNAEAVSNTVILEIPFSELDGTLNKLPPWFHGMVKTLVSRIENNNKKIENLENNLEQVRGRRESNITLYDTIKLLTALSITFSGHGIDKGSKYLVGLENVRFYASNIFTIHESKVDIFLKMFMAEENLSVQEQEYENQSAKKFIVFHDKQSVTRNLSFFCQQANLKPTLQMYLSSNCLTLLKAMIKSIDEENIKKSQIEINVNSLLDGIQEEHPTANYFDLDDAVKYELCEPLIIGKKNEMTMVAHYNKIKAILPSLLLKRTIDEYNESNSQY